MAQSIPNRIPLHDEYALAVEDMSVLACKKALTRLSELAASVKARQAVAELHHLTSYSRRIDSCLETGRQALNASDSDNAALEWARALVLMNAMAVEAGRNDNIVPAPQKSGKTG